MTGAKPLESNALLSILERAVPSITPAAQLAVRVDGKLALSRAFGWLDPETRAHPADRDTLFDLASLTKLFTTTAFMTLVEAGSVALDQPVSTVLPAFSGLRPLLPERPLLLERPIPDGGTVDAGQVTFRNLLAHNAGLPATLIVDTAGTARTDPEAVRTLALNTGFAYPTGSRVIYSDIGLILLGMAVEALSGQRLDVAIRERVTAPLGLRRTRFLTMTPDLMPYFAYDTVDPDPNIAPTEYCRWRGRRIQGEVHDENAWRMMGVSGHAGLFSTAEAVAAFGQVFLDEGRGTVQVPSTAPERRRGTVQVPSTAPERRRGTVQVPLTAPERRRPILRPETVAEMVREQSAEGATRRGIGFQLWSPDPEASSYPFSPQTFGHTGFTGTSLWIDPARRMVAALLTNEIYYGRENRKIAALRLAVNRELAALVDVKGF